MNAVDMIAACGAGQSPKTTDEPIRRVLTLRCDDRIVPYEPVEPERVTLPMLLLGAGLGAMLCAAIVYGVPVVMAWWAR